MDNKGTAKYIERIKIKGLWGRYDVDWQLHKDVNILVGENGTGKSTILEVVKLLFQGKYADIRKKCTFVYLVLDNEQSMGLGSNDILPLKSAKDGLNVVFMKTFDAPFFTKTEQQHNRKQYITSTLDDDLDVVVTNYLIYQNKLLRRKGDRNKILEKNDYFFETINRLLEQTHKTIIEDTDEITDVNLLLKVLTDDNKKLSIFELSSGEKQMLLILLTVLCQDEQPSVLLLDEPEMSLHYSWQYELIKIIRTLNPNCQVIIATHSSSIFAKGWMNKFFFIEAADEKAITYVCKP